MSLRKFVTTYRDTIFPIKDLPNLEEVLSNGAFETTHTEDLEVVGKCISHVLSAIADPKRQYLERDFSDPWISKSIEFYRYALKTHDEELDALSEKDPFHAETLKNKAKLLSYKADLFANIFYSINNVYGISLQKKLMNIQRAFGNKYGAGKILKQLYDPRAQKLLETSSTLGKDGYFVAKCSSSALTEFESDNYLPKWGARWRNSSEAALEVIKPTDLIPLVHSIRKLANVHYNIGKDYDPNNLQKAKKFYKRFLFLTKDLSHFELPRYIAIVQKRLDEL